MKKIDVYVLWRQLKLNMFRRFEPGRATKREQGINKIYRKNG